MKRTEDQGSEPHQVVFTPRVLVTDCQSDLRDHHPPLLLADEGLRGKQDRPCSVLEGGRGHRTASARRLSLKAANVTGFFQFSDL